MNLYQKILDFLRLKKRSAPNDKNWMEYFIFFLHPHLYVHVDENIILLALSTLTLFSPKAIFIFIPAVFYRIYSNSEYEIRRNKGGDAREVVNLIQHGHMQSLKEKIELDPDLLEATYKNKSLLYWSKYYNNYKAHKFIIDQIKMRNEKKQTAA